MYASPYRRFEPGEVSRLSDQRLEIASLFGGDGAQLDRVDFELASLFDGLRSGEQICREALGKLRLRITRSRLEGFAADLAVAGLLRPGRNEPLPTPAHSDAEAAWRGWTGEGVDRVVDGGNAVPPSALPGSRNGPGLTGALTGLVTGLRGQATASTCRCRQFFLSPSGACCCGRCGIGSRCSHSSRCWLRG